MRWLIKKKDKFTNKRGMVWMDIPIVHEDGDSVPNGTTVVVKVRVVHRIKGE